MIGTNRPMIQRLKRLMQRLLLLGLNHTTAPLDVREKVAFSPEQSRKAIESFRAKFTDAEIVLLSTCNRVELYISRQVHGHPRADEMAEFLSEFHAVELEQLRPHLYEKDGRAAMEHLF